MKKTILLLFFVSIFLLVTGCKKDEVEAIPDETTSGGWEIILSSDQIVSNNDALEAYNKAKEMGLKTVVGQCVSSDRFYDDNQNWKLWKKYGAKGIEMESAELYTLAAEFNRKALTILTVSDHILKGTATTAEERQTTFKDMMKLALETIIA